jgi:PAS domain-containing protein
MKNDSSSHLHNTESDSAEKVNRRKSYMERDPLHWHGYEEGPHFVFPGEEFPQVSKGPIIGFPDINDLNEWRWRPCRCEKVAFEIQLGDPLPDHVCVNNLYWSCMNWLRELDLSNILRLKSGRTCDCGSGCMHAIQMKHILAILRNDQEEMAILEDEMFGQDPDPVFVPIGERRIAVSDQYEWPIPLYNSHSSILGVLRQWVGETDEKKRKKLARSLESKPEWDETIRQIAGHGLFLRAMDPDIIRYNRFPEILIGYARDLLQQRGFPWTLETGVYAVSKVLDFKTDAPLLPTRGLHVTSFILVDDVEEDLLEGVESALRDKSSYVYSSIGGVPSWATKELWVSAAEIAKSHADWWKKISHTRMPEFDLLKEKGRNEDDPLNQDLDAWMAGDLTREVLFDRNRARRLDQWKAAHGNRVSQLRQECLYRTADKQLEMRIKRLENATKKDS